LLTGEFATQTCFQGRFGEEVGSDQFGGCIMFHAPQPNQNLAIGRIEYVEVNVDLLKNVFQNSWRPSRINMFLEI